MKPEDWKPGTFDAIATQSKSKGKIIIKAVNYEAKPNILLVRLQGASVPAKARVKIYTITADIYEAPSLTNPDKIKPVEENLAFSDNITIPFDPYTVKVIEIEAK